MRASSDTEVRAFYEDSADAYSRMMDAEIDQALYANTLGKLAEQIAELEIEVADQ